VQATPTLSISVADKDAGRTRLSVDRIVPIHGLFGTP
jgi:hypothetical protein